MQPIDIDKLMELREQKNDLAVINVLPSERFRRRHIPNSQNIPLGASDFAEQVEKAAGGRDRPVVVYCASEDCDASPKAAANLESAGFTDVYDFTGGMEAWQEAGRPVQAGWSPED